MTDQETYRSNKTWVIPAEVEDDAVDWRINVCFPSDFQSVPQPTGALKDCKCLRETPKRIKLDKDKKKKEIEDKDTPIKK